MKGFEVLTACTSSNAQTLLPYWISLTTDSKRAGAAESATPWRRASRSMRAHSWPQWCAAFSASIAARIGTARRSPVRSPDV